MAAIHGCEDPIRDGVEVPSPVVPAGENVVAHPRARTGSARGRQMSPRRVRDLISLSIRMGYIAPDDQLVEHDLIELFNTSRTSVRAALTQLSQAGMIERRPRAGTRVGAVGLTIPLADISSVDQAVYLEILEDRVVPMFPLARDQLQLHHSDTLRMVENSFVHQDSVIGMRTAYFSNDLEFAPADSVRTGPMRMIDVMDVAFRTRPGAVDVSIGADIADARDTRLMGVQVGTPLVIREMTYYSHDGTPVQIVFDRFRYDRVHVRGSAAI